MSEPSGGQLHIYRAADAKENQQGIVIPVTWELGPPLWGVNFDYYDLGALGWFVNMKVISFWRHMIEKWKQWKKLFGLPLGATALGMPNIDGEDAERPE